MRTLTIRFCRTLLIILFVELVWCLPGWAQDYVPIPNVPITSFHKSVLGVAVIARAEVMPVSARDANFRATAWDLTRPEAGWDQAYGTAPAAMDRDLLRVYVDVSGMASPNMRQHITEFGLTIDFSDEYTYKASYIPGKGYAVDFRPGSLRAGPYRFYLYVVHDNDLSGVTVGPFVFQGNAEGQLSSSTSIFIKEAPADFDQFSPPIRNRFREGFRSTRAEDILDVSVDLADPAKFRDAVLQYRRDFAAAQADQHQQAALAALIANGQVCPTCLDAGKTGADIAHILEACPALYPSRRVDGGVAAPPPAAIAPPPPAVATAPSPSSIAPAPAQAAAVVPAPAPAPSANPPNPYPNVPPPAWQRAQDQLRRYPVAAGTCKTIIVVSNRHGQPVTRFRGAPLVIDLTWATGADSRYLPATGTMSVTAAPSDAFQIQIRGDRRAYTPTLVADQATYVFITL